MPWLDQLRYVTGNKLTYGEVSWEFRQWVTQGFPNFQLDGSSVTRFFKHCLQAPDALINKLAQAFENQSVEATYTISIDPVDMMLASENPYDWGSCYRLNPDDEENHADGCLAAVLDTTSLITYVWNREGEYTLKSSELKFKNIRYKKMRAWISISPDFNAFYMNKVYPGKSEYGEDFEKALRVIIENTISKYTTLEDVWSRRYDAACKRYYPYGYNEYDVEDRTFVRRGFEGIVQDWYVYDVRIKCPCGCGMDMPGFCDDCAEVYDNSEYNGEGYGCQGVKEEFYCEYSGDYCDCHCEDDCVDCYYWQQAHPMCSLDEGCECRYPNEVTVCDGVAQACEQCKGCSIWDEEQEEMQDEE